MANANRPKHNEAMSPQQRAKLERFRQQINRELAEVADLKTLPDDIGPAAWENQLLEVLDEIEYRLKADIFITNMQIAVGQA